MVVSAGFRARHVEPMHHAGLAVGNQERVGGRVESKTAERRSGICDAIERDIGEQAHLAGRAVNAPDRAGAAAFRCRAEQTCHEGRICRAFLRTVGHSIIVGIGYDDRQAVDRCGSNVDIRRNCVIERHAEYLADLAGSDGERLRCDECLRSRRRAGRLQINHPNHGAVAID